METIANDGSVTICIPTLNEERNIGLVIQRIQAEVMCPYDLLVVDGGSTDRTREIAEDLGAEVLIDPGGGKGVALRFAIEQCANDIIVFIDADGSHDPGDIEPMIKPILDGKYDLVVGSRMLGGSDELHGDLAKFVRIVGSDIITLGINYRFNVRLTDSQNGFRALKTDLGRRLNLREKITTIEQEMLIKALHLKARCGEIRAHEYKRMYGESCISVPKMCFRYVYSWVANLFFPRF